MAQSGDSSPRPPSRVAPSRGVAEVNGSPPDNEELREDEIEMQRRILGDDVSLNNEESKEEGRPSPVINRRGRNQEADDVSQNGPPPNNGPTALEAQGEEEGEEEPHGEEGGGEGQVDQSPAVLGHSPKWNSHWECPMHGEPPTHAVTFDVPNSEGEISDQTLEFLVIYKWIAHRSIHGRA